MKNEIVVRKVEGTASGTLVLHEKVIVSLAHGNDSPLDDTQTLSARWMHGSRKTDSSFTLITGLVCSVTTWPDL